MKNIIAVILILFCSGQVLAQGAPGADAGTRISLTAMALTSSTKQGGQGPQGSTFLTHSELLHSWDWFGVGVYFQYDRHGESQTDTAVGPKIEFSFSPL